VAPMDRAQAEAEELCHLRRHVACLSEYLNPVPLQHGRSSLPPHCLIQLIQREAVTVFEDPSR
jgi:hypothetical protein